MATTKGGVLAARKNADSPMKVMQNLLVTMKPQIEAALEINTMHTK